MTLSLASRQRIFSSIVQSLFECSATFAPPTYIALRSRNGHLLAYRFFLINMLSIMNFQVKSEEA